MAIYHLPRKKNLDIEHRGIPMDLRVQNGKAADNSKRLKSHVPIFGLKPRDNFAGLKGKDGWVAAEENTKSAKKNRLRCI